MSRTNLKDNVIDEKLKNFFNTYYIGNETTDVSSAFYTLPRMKRLEIMEEYLVYFFTYAFSTSGQNFKYRDILDRDFDGFHAGSEKRFYNVFSREVSYNIDTKNGEEEEADDTFNITIRYVNYGSDKKIVSVNLWISYDLFESASIGFEFVGAYDDDKVREELKEMFVRVYNKIMADDVLHVWYMMGDLEDTLRRILLDF